MGPLNGPDPAVVARGVGYRYPSGRTGLRPLDFSARPGEIVAVLGPNGSGKSTLLRLLATDLRPSTGSLALLGRPVRGSLARIRRRIGYAPDTPVHFGVLTGRENADRFHRMVPGPAADAVPALLRAFDLAAESDVPVSEYSYGMRRKLLLVEALSFAPRLAVLDEPAVGLDPRGVSALRDAVSELRGTGGCVVIASNEVREVPLWSDRVVFLHRGRIVEAAPLAELLARLAGHTRIEVGLEDAAPGPWLGRLAEVRGVAGATPTPAGAVIESPAGTEPLPGLLEVLLEAKCRVRSVRVRRPDLGDLFEALTGERLAERRSARAGREAGG